MTLKIKKDTLRRIKKIRTKAFNLWNEIDDLVVDLRLAGDPEI